MTLVPEDTTPLDPEELAGLKLSYISTRAELNAAEAVNIEVGLRWAGRGLPGGTAGSRFLCELHRRMFGDVWKSGRGFTT
ncbi:MAG: mobile mystery protein B, partial [Acidimicrobiales bacterium]